jgi:hypothetical protein
MHGRFCVAENLDASSNHDNAGNQSKDQIRKSGSGERYQATANHGSQVGESISFREYRASTNVYLARPVLLQKNLRS